MSVLVPMQYNLVETVAATDVHVIHTAYVAHHKSQIVLVIRAGRRISNQFRRYRITQKTPSKLISAALDDNRLS